MTQDIRALAAAAAAAGPNFNEAEAFVRSVPKAGPTRLRLVAYVEVGKQTTTYEGVPKVVDQAHLTFELSGPNHPPAEVDGVKKPVVTTLKLTLSRNEKATYFKLFKQMNHTGSATHFAQLLGEAFRGRVYHEEKEKDGKKVTYWGLKDPATGVFSIGAPVARSEDPETGEERIVKLQVDQPLSPLRLFIWNTASEASLKTMWDSIFIDGEYGAEGKKVSANVFQNAIKKAENFSGSPIDALLRQGGKPLDPTDGETGRAGKVAQSTSKKKDPMDDIPY